MSEHHPLFPVNLQSQWQSPEQVALSPTVSNWLLDASSLTARLKKHCQAFKVQVLGQEIQPCHPLEANEDIHAGEQVLVREVLLFCDDIPQVFARSLLPLRSLTGEEKQLAELGTQSLGQVLFNNPKLIRKCIEVSNQHQNSKVIELAKSYQLDNLTEFWGRRSVFVLDGKPLMVAEIFLPGALAYQKEYSQR